MAPLQHLPRPRLTRSCFTRFFCYAAAAVTLLCAGHPFWAPALTPKRPTATSASEVPRPLNRHARRALTSILNDVWATSPSPRPRTRHQARCPRCRPPQLTRQLPGSNCASPRWPGWPLRAHRVGEAANPGPPSPPPPAPATEPHPTQHTFADTILLSDSDEAPAPPPGPCAVCLEPFAPACPRRRRPIAWPTCGHCYHFSCLARLRAQVQPPRCAQCRSPWPEGPEHDDTLSRLCGTVGVNPFRDSEAETPGPPHHPPAPLGATARHPPRQSPPAQTPGSTSPSSGPRPASKPKLPHKPGKPSAASGGP